ncbi:MAG TPA: methyltransferase domain-containing protein [Burkholderiaceae bacterium]|nr:methyltransferase domain-containing protein [Burkholderiaceae bacterium]
MSAPIHYDVVSCSECGFTFASNIPNQASLNYAYQNAENHIHQKLAPGLAQIHQDFYHFVTSNIKLSLKTEVLDIGSGMGHFLYHFKKAGFQRLTGVEPSATATKLAQQVYGLNIQNHTIDTFRSNSSYDLITLCGVLEHIADLQNAARHLNELLSPEGHIFIAVPDASRFGNCLPKEPFLEFALEHINFFSRVSLGNLMRLAGFEEVISASHHNDFYDNYYILGLYRKAPLQADTPSAFIVDKKTAASVHTYAHKSTQQHAVVATIMARLADDEAPLLVWGAGSLTSRLMCDTRLAEAKIIAIIDRNQALQGKHIMGIPIVEEDFLTQHPGTTVLVASTTYALEIVKLLKEQYQWTGQIVTLIGVAEIEGTNESAP